MKTTKRFVLAIAFLFLCAGFASVKAQTAPPFKVTAIKIVPFEELTGEFEEEIKPKDKREFFNEVSTGLLVTVEISGQTETMTENRKLETTVLKGGKMLTKKLISIIGVGASGKYYAPLYIDGGICEDITITAKIIGQKTPSTMTRKIMFACGE